MILHQMNFQIFIPSMFHYWKLEHKYYHFQCCSHKVFILYAVFSFSVLRFNFHMILHQRNIQIRISYTALVTKFASHVLPSVSGFRDLTFIWSFIKGIFKFKFLSLLQSQRIHLACCLQFQGWDLTFIWSFIKGTFKYKFLVLEFWHLILICHCLQFLNLKFRLFYIILSLY